MGCSTTPQREAWSKHCLSYEENRKSFFKYSKCMDGLEISQNKQQNNQTNSQKSTNAAGLSVICSLSRDFKSCMSGAMESISDTDSQSKTDRKLRELEDKMSRMEREQRARELQRNADRIQEESRKKRDDLMKWKPGDK